MYDIITMGSSTVDIFARSESEMIKIFNSEGETDLLAFPTGSKLLINKLQYSIGGGGTNTACALSKLGLKVAYVGKIGKGYNAIRVIESLKKSKVDTHLVKRCNEHTAISLILDNMEKDRVILAHKGVNNSLDIKDVKLSDLKTGWIFCTSMMGRSFETAKKVARYSRKKGIKFGLNPSSYMVKQGEDFLRPLLKNVDVLTFNYKESMMLTGESELNKIFSRLHSFGIRIIVITEGKKGVHASDGEHIYSAKAPKVKKVVDTTGAGDVFAASFVAGLIRKDDIDLAIRLGMANSGALITEIGAQNGTLSWNRALRDAKQIKVKKVRFDG